LLSQTRTNNTILAVGAETAQKCMSSPLAIHIINSEGAVLREFAVDSLGHPLFEYPRSIDVTSDGEVVAQATISTKWCHNPSNDINLVTNTNKQYHSCCWY
jgi:hypothetical protein